MKLVIDISKARYDEIMSMDWKNCRRFFDEEIRAIHDGKEPKTGWISVSERLPEEHKEVLTCSLGGFIEIQSIEGDYWENQHGDWSDIDEVDVVAWMPLPTPYKASQTGAESEGHWIVRIFPEEHPFFAKRYYCSVCGDCQTHGAFKHCPNCGVSMSGEVETE